MHVTDGSSAVADIDLSARFASFTLHHAGVTGGRPVEESSFQTPEVSSPGLQSSHGTQTEFVTPSSSSPCPCVSTVDADVQCCPEMTDKGTAMTDCRTVGLHNLTSISRYAELSISMDLGSQMT